MRGLHFSIFTKCFRTLFALRISDKRSFLLHCKKSIYFSTFSLRIKFLMIPDVGLPKVVSRHVQMVVIIWWHGNQQIHQSMAFTLKSKWDLATQKTCGLLWVCPLWEWWWVKRCFNCLFSGIFLQIDTVYIILVYNIAPYVISNEADGNAKGYSVLTSLTGFKGWNNSLPSATLHLSSIKTALKY